MYQRPEAAINRKKFPYERWVKKGLLLRNGTAKRELNVRQFGERLTLAFAAFDLPHSLRVEHRSSAISLEVVNRALFLLIAHLGLFVFLLCEK